VSCDLPFTCVICDAVSDLANQGEAIPPTTGATACSQFVQDFADNTD